MRCPTRQTVLVGGLSSADNKSAQDTGWRIYSTGMRNNGITGYSLSADVLSFMFVTSWYLATVKETALEGMFVPCVLEKDAFSTLVTYPARHGKD